MKEAMLSAEPSETVREDVRCNLPVGFALVREARVVAVGVSFPTAGAVVQWLGEHRSTVVWPDMTDAMVVHGHEGTELIWDDRAWAPAQDAHTPRERTQTRTGGTESGEGGGGAQEGAPRRRLKACVEAWPEAETMAYDPRCCRFPKSCSADVYDDGISEDRLEPMPAGREGGEDEPFVAASALGDKLRALGVRFQRGVSNSDPANDEDIELSGYAYWVTVQGVEALAAEVDRMAQTLDGALTSAAVFKEDRDRLRGQVEAIRAAIDREAAHGDAVTRCNLVAERFRTVLDGAGSEAGGNGEVGA